jgi:hypothetical protein
MYQLVVSVASIKLVYISTCCASDRWVVGGREGEWRVGRTIKNIYRYGIMPSCFVVHAGVLAERSRPTYQSHTAISHLSHVCRRLLGVANQCHRLILLDCQPILSPSVVLSMLRGEIGEGEETRPY